MDNSQGALLNDINIYVTLIYIYHEIKVNFKIPRLFPLWNRFYQIEMFELEHRYWDLCSNSTHIYPE